MQAVIFDFDGTLLNSEREWDKYLWPLAQKSFPGITWEQFGYFTGSTTEQGYVHFSEIYEPKLTIQEYSQEIANFIPALYKSAPLNEGIMELLTAVQEANIPLGIATSSKRKWIEPSLASHGIAEFFRTIVTLNDVEKSKPHPEPYLLAAKNLGVDPTQCIAIEDSVLGMASAQAAGMKCIGYAYAENAQDLSKADLQIADFRELDLRQLQSL